MKTKKLTLLLVSLFLTSCSQAVPTSSSMANSSSSTSSISASSSYSETSSSDPSTYIYKTGTLYEANYDATKIDYVVSEFATLSYLIDPYYGVDRAFVSISSFVNAVSAQDADFYINETKAIVEFSENMGTFSITKEDGVCTFTSLSYIASLGLADYPLDLGKTTIAEANPHSVMTSHSSSAANSVSFSLSDYSIPYYFVNDDVYLPISVFSGFFFYLRSASITFNGTNFYYIQDPDVLGVSSTSSVRTEFARHYYETSTMKDKTEKSQAVATLDANLFLFTIDTFYGFISEEPYSNNYGAYLQKEYPETYEGLFSTNADTVLNSYDRILRVIMGDGHSSTFNYTGYTGSFYNNGEHDSSNAGYSQRVDNLSTINSRLLKQRMTDLNLESTSLGENYLEMNDTTAIIRFDSFVSNYCSSNQTDEFYESNAENDLFSLFYTCYRKIEKKGGIENVIIDLSCNGGGDTLALIEALGFVVDNPEVYIYDRASQTSFTAKYRTDCNADGVFENDESPANKYSHYILTSGYSFSCGNAMPYYAKVGGVKTIGQTSGGGGCATVSLISSDGYPIQISGPLNMGKTSPTDTGIDDGVTPDIVIPEEDFYNIDKLTEYITAE